MYIIQNLKNLACAQLLQSCPTLYDSLDCSPPRSSLHGILQARILEWVATPSSRGSSQPRDRTRVSYIVGGFSATQSPGKLRIIKKEIRGIHTGNWDISGAFLRTSPGPWSKAWNVIIRRRSRICGEAVPLVKASGWTAREGPHRLDLGLPRATKFM